MTCLLFSHFYIFHHHFFFSFLNCNIREKTTKDLFFNFKNKQTKTNSIKQKKPYLFSS